MITVERDPTLIDFLVCANHAPEDQRDHFTKLTGMPYIVDDVAVGNFQVPGLKWVFKNEKGYPLLVGGFVQQRPGVWRDFLISTEEAFGPKYWMSCTKAARRIMDQMFVADAHRIECIAPASRVKAISWYRIMGYTLEAPLRKYCADGSDAVAFVRVRG